MAPIISADLFHGFPVSNAYIGQLKEGFKEVCTDPENPLISTVEQLLEVLMQSSVPFSRERVRLLWKKAEEGGALPLRTAPNLVPFITLTYVTDEERAGYGPGVWKLPSVPVMNAAWADKAVVVADTAATLYAWAGQRSDGEFTLAGARKHLKDRALPRLLAAFYDQAQHTVTVQLGSAVLQDEYKEWVKTGNVGGEEERLPSFSSVTEAVQYMLNQPIIETDAEDDGPGAAGLPTNPLPDYLTAHIQGSAHMATLQQWGLLRMVTNPWDKEVLIAAAALDPNRYPLNAMSRDVAIIPYHLARSTLEDLMPAPDSDADTDNSGAAPQVAASTRACMLRWAALLVGRGKTRDVEHVLAMAKAMDTTIAAAVPDAGAPNYYEQLLAAGNAALAHELGATEVQPVTKMQLIEQYAEPSEEGEGDADDVEASSSESGSEEEQPLATAAVVAVADAVESEPKRQRVE